MLTRLSFLCFCLLPIFAQAQLYTNASANLPNNGARNPSMDVRAADLDGDGDLDIILANEGPPNTILLNDGQGNFTNGTIGNLPQENHDSEDVAIADFNGDGHLDLVFCSEDDIVLGFTNVHEYYFGDGTGSFTPAGYQPPDTEANAVIVAEINGDTFPDLLFGNNGGTGVLINTGSEGTFSEAPERVPQINRTTQDLAMADVDGDLDLDLFEGNENGNLLHINDGTGFFTDETTARLPQGLNLETRKVTFGDVDNDDDLDIFLSNVGFIPGKNRQNRLFINDGTGHFTDATATQLPSDLDHTIDAIFDDVDLDNDLDIVVANVFGAPIKIYENDGNGFFTDATISVLGQSYVRDALGVIAADFNGDGLRDLYICDRNTPQNNQKDLLLLRAPITSTIAPSTDSDLVLYPNPVKDFFYLQTGQENINTLSIMNVEGKVICHLTPEKIGAGLYLCKVGHQRMPSGVYWAVTTDGRRVAFVVN